MLAYYISINIMCTKIKKLMTWSQYREILNVENKTDIILVQKCIFILEKYQKEIYQNITFSSPMTSVILFYYSTFLLSLLFLFF